MCGLREPAAGGDDLACLDPQPGLSETDYRGCRWIEGKPTPLRPGSVALRRCRAAHGVPSIERSSGPTGARIGAACATRLRTGVPRLLSYHIE
jgi:hypothetical protein